MIKDLRETVSRVALNRGETWARGHVAACARPQGGEIPILLIADGITAYAHNMAGGRETVFDGVLSPGVGDMLHGFLTLLNGDIGRLDGGTCDTWARNIAAAVEWDLDMSEPTKD